MTNAPHPSQLRSPDAREALATELNRPEREAGSAQEAPAGSPILAREPVNATPRRAMTPKRRLEVLLKCDGRCAKCKEKLGGRFVVDHVLPLELGGLDEVGNLESLCVPCDKLKTKGDRKRIDKTRRLSKKATAPREPSRLRSRGFDKTVSKRFDGSVVRREPRAQTCGEET